MVFEVILIYIHWFLLLIPIQIGEAFSLQDQHGTTFIVQPRLGEIKWILFGSEAKTVKMMSQWIKQAGEHFLRDNKIICVADITDMPRSIKEKRFLPQIRSFPIQVFLIDGGLDLNWAPRQKGAFTLIQLKKDGKYDFFFPGDPLSIEKIIKTEAP